MNDELENEAVLQLVASYAYPLADKDRHRFQIGESQVGTCFQENRIIEFDNVPEGYIQISSGLGKSMPNYLVLIPINLDQNIIGVMEIAALRKIEPYKINFMQKLNETLTSILGNEKANQRMREMFEKMNTQAEELKSQEEELRQNLEEMHATREEAQRREDELLARLKEYEK